MIPIPPCVAGQTLVTTANGWRITNSETDPEGDLPNGGYSFNPWWGSPTGNYEDVINRQETFNQNTPTSVSEAGNLLITTPYSSGPFLPARV